MWYKLKRILIYPDGVTEKQVRPTQSSQVLFDFWDWTNSQWSVWWGSQWTITKTANSIMFSIGTDYSTNYLSQYPIDWTKDFLLEFNANIPSTSVGTHQAGLYNPNITIAFTTAWQSSYRNKMRCHAGGQYVADGGANPWTADYFIKKEWNVLTMWWNNTTVYTDNNYSFESEYYLCEQVYNDTLTINTAKLTYL